MLLAFAKHETCSFSAIRRFGQLQVCKAQNELEATRFAFGCPDPFRRLGAPKTLLDTLPATSTGLCKKALKRKAVFLQGFVHFHVGWWEGNKSKKVTDVFPVHTSFVLHHGGHARFGCFGSRFGGAFVRLGWSTHVR